MMKYKDTYYIVKQKNYSDNKDDAYIKCKKNAQIYKYDADTLCIQFNSNKYSNIKLKELSELGVYLTTLQCGDDEQTYLFPECALEKLAAVVKAKKRIKRDLTDEQREVLRNRMLKIRESSKK